MKKTVFTTFFALVSALATAAGAPNAMPLSDAQSKVGEAAVNAKTMGAIMAKLSPADQKKFLATVNAAIAKLPGSADDRTAKFVDANRAALLNAQKGNLSALVTEMFATVEVAALPTIVETFSQELFNRAADPDKTYVDAEYTKIAKAVVNQVETRTAEDKTGGARTTFAVLMFVQASNGSKEVEKNLLEGISNAETRDLATREWVPAAMGETQKKSYDPILGYVGELQMPAVETEAPVEVNLVVPETLRQETLMADLAESVAATSKDGEKGAGEGSSQAATGGSTFQSVDAQSTAGKTSAAGDTITGGADQPRTTEDKPWSPSPTPTPTPEPGPYANQTP